MNLIEKMALSIVLLCAIPFAHAGLVTQSFTSSWTVDIWDYYGDLAAMKWHYQPYAPWDTATGNLTSVVITTQITGTRADANDTVRIRESFFTGWNPVSYQFSDNLYLTGDGNSFGGVWTYTYATPAAIAAVTDYQYFTGEYQSGAGTGGAWYYFESRTENAGHSIDATTTISYYFDSISVSEPISLFILCIGVFALREIRRQGER